LPERSWPTGSGGSRSAFSGSTVSDTEHLSQRDGFSHRRHHTACTSMRHNGFCAPPPRQPLCMNPTHTGHSATTTIPDLSEMRRRIPSARFHEFLAPSRDRGSSFQSPVWPCAARAFSHLRRGSFTGFHPPARRSACPP
jgi:hypothetical protein